MGGDLDRELVSTHAGALVDVGAYLARLIRLDPQGVVRVQQKSDGHLTLWAMPLGVLTRRDVMADLAGTTDTTLSGAELLARVEPAHDSGAGRLGLPPARDAAWRASLPPPGGWELVDTVPGAALLRSADQAAETVRASRPYSSVRSARRSLLMKPFQRPSRSAFLWMDLVRTSALLARLVRGQLDGAL